MTTVSSAPHLSVVELGGIARAMRAEGVPLGGDLRATLIARGRSNLTFSLTDGMRTWVLRMPPRTGRTPSAHDVAREYRVTSALAGTEVPVPPTVLLHEDESLLGGPFVLTEFVEGVTIQTRLELDLAEAPGPALTRTLVGSLAALHRVDYVAAGLGAFGRPDGYAARQLRRWSGQWEIVGSAEHERAAQTLLARLHAQVPEQRSTSIVHGDFRIDNTILDLTKPDDPRVAAIVDWELSTIGDPVADVAMMCAYRNDAFDLIVGEASAWTSPRLASVPDILGQYEAAGGTSLENWTFHLALAYFKVAVIAAGIDHRVRAEGAVRDGHGTAGLSVLPYLELGIRTIEERP
ncbi:acyl-CoA dehydrogenase [Nocardioides sp. Root1257]|uniref:phosphotransferase family protein n=1 Tax=unclassified Nocardioides TaxID=2615069 RepID=UPI0006FA4486|nr:MULTISPECIES: phosphotransferase family protein [unclassified Nocardioides]KQW45007.1 acyl-CoA dehydrogenase [Nocardioides sp. Root1257]KRC45989.1 acyl-CoA dehydrogenase [Nocardioides sp. Root224]